MAYPGDPDLDPKVQQRIMTAFGEAVRVYREGHAEEARTILRSIFEVDPRFGPAQRLEKAIGLGAQIDLAELLGEVSAAEAFDADAVMKEAFQAFAARSFDRAAELARQVLRELPGHAEARNLVSEVQNHQRASSEAESHLERARTALDAGAVDEARSFAGIVRKIYPAHPELADLEARIAATGPSTGAAEAGFEFEVYDEAAEPPVSEGAVEPEPAVVPEPVPEPKASEPAGGASPDFSSPAGDSGGFQFAQQPGDAAGFAFSAPPAGEQAEMADDAWASPPPDEPGAGEREFDFTAEEPAPSGEEFGQEAQSFDFTPAGPSSQGDDFVAASEADFGIAPPGPSPATPEPAPASDDPAARVQELLDQGQLAFDRGDFQAAIDTWSRIYLIDAHNAAAESRIELARSRREETDRLAEHRFYEAREAFEHGRLDEARELCQKVLELQPQHLEAHDLLQRLETPSAPPPAPMAPPPAAEEEEDLFRDDFVPSGITKAPPPPPKEAAAAAPARPRRPEAGARRTPSVPLPLLLALVGLVVVLAVAGFLLRGTVFSGDSGALAEALAEAERAAQDGRYQDAINVLETMTDRLEGEDANRALQRIQTYRQQLKARAAPTPQADAGPVLQAIAKGERVRALRELRAAQARVPGDPELRTAQEQLAAYSPLLPALADAMAARRWESVRQLSAEILKSHPNDEEVTRIWEKATFNEAVLRLRRYEVPAAHALLSDIVQRTGDAEARRVDELAVSYLSRPIDPRYQIFVTSIELRSMD